MKQSEEASLVKSIEYAIFALVTMMSASLVLGSLMLGPRTSCKATPARLSIGPINQSSMPFHLGIYPSRCTMTSISCVEAI